MRALKTATPNLSPVHINAELELLLVPNLWKRWIRQNARLDDQQKIVLESHSQRRTSYQIIYKGLKTTAMNLERAVLDAGAKATSSATRELF